MLSRRQLLSALGMLPAARLLSGQESKPSFSTDVKVVNLFATVRDKKDQVIRSLTKDDFVLDEDGRPQTIQYFAEDSNLPLTVGLLVDTSGSTRAVLPDECSASDRFLQQVLRPKEDLAFLIHFDFEVELMQDLTGSRELLEKALLQVENPPQLQRNRGGNPGGGPGGYPGGRRGGRGGGGGTLLYDAIFLAADEVLKKQGARKAIILLTDGEDNGSKVSLATAVEAAQRADTLVYSILFENPDSGIGGFGMGRRDRGGWGGRGGGGRGGNRPDGRAVLRQISGETGGRFFEVSRKQPIAKVFSMIEEDLRHQYSIGYSPDRTSTGGYRRIHLTTKQKGLTVQTREGYYPA